MHISATTKALLAKTEVKCYLITFINFQDNNEELKKA